MSGRLLFKHVSFSLTFMINVMAGSEPKKYNYYQYR